MNKWLALFLSIGLTGCTSSIVFKDIDLRPIEKNKASGVVKMAADVEVGVEPIVNQKKAFADVLEQCQDWQYEGAILLNDYELKCKEGTDEDCKVFQISYKYLCLNKDEVELYQEGNFDPALRNK